MSSLKYKIKSKTMPDLSRYNKIDLHTKVAKLARVTKEGLQPVPLVGRGMDVLAFRMLQECLLVDVTDIHVMVQLMGEMGLLNYHNLLKKIVFAAAKWTACKPPKDRSPPVYTYPEDCSISDTSAERRSHINEVISAFHWLINALLVSDYLCSAPVEADVHYVTMFSNNVCFDTDSEAANINRMLDDEVDRRIKESLLPTADVNQQRYRIIALHTPEARAIVSMLLNLQLQDQPTVPV